MPSSFTATHRETLQKYCNTLQHTTPCEQFNLLSSYTATHCTAKHCDTLQHTTPCDNFNMLSSNTATHCDTQRKHCNTMLKHFSTLQHTATHYTTWQLNMLSEHTTTHCDTLPKCCNTLWYTTPCDKINLWGHDSFICVTWLIHM